MHRNRLKGWRADGRVLIQSMEISRSGRLCHSRKRSVSVPQQLMRRVAMATGENGRNVAILLPHQTILHKSEEKFVKVTCLPPEMRRESLSCQSMSR